MADERPLHVGRPNIGDRELFHRYVDEIFDACWLSNDGQMLQRLEAELQQFTGARNCVVVANGTLALEVAARAADLTGEVIVPAYTFVATAHALRWLGLTPVFADIDPATHNIDPDAVEALITDRTSAVIGVHLWGRIAPVQRLAEIADRHGIKLMFDAAHAFGCSAGGQSVGTNGDAEILSFHATKFFNTFEGGAIVTDDDELAKRARLMRNFGFAGMDEIVSLGINAKMSEVGAAMGLVNLRMVPEIVEHNRKNYLRYLEHVTAMPDLSMVRFDEDEENNYQYVVLEVAPEAAAGRDEILAHLHAHNVLARRYFWPGAHLVAPYRDEPRYQGLELPATDAVAGRVLVLPTGPGVGDEDIDRVMTLIGQALADGRMPGSDG